MDVEADALVYSPPTSSVSREARPEQETLTIRTPLDLDVPYYDMTKKKYLYIFNHFKFDKSTNNGDYKLKDRHGTHFDVKILESTFQALGFEVIICQDLTRYKIRKTIEKLLNEDHSQTSCVALAILTHGTHDSYLYARDEAYELKDITKLLESPRLATIPKLMFLQISVVMDELPPRPMLFQRMGSWRSSVSRFSISAISRISKIYSNMRKQDTTTECDAAVANDCCNGACRGHALDKGHEVEVDGIIRKFVHVPSHIDFLILHSAADGHASFRAGEKGSWMIQSLCSMIQKYHTNLDILQIITLVNKRVAYDFTASNTNHPSYDKKKQSLEARYTLTKFLRL